VPEGTGTTTAAVTPSPASLATEALDEFEKIVRNMSTKPPGAGRREVVGRENAEERIY
jgi:hypothetical protein